MLQLIDQVNPNRLMFRCTACQHTGISTHSRGLDGFFEAVLPDGRVQWQRHVCNPAAMVPIAPPPPRQRRTPRTKAVPASVAMEPEAPKRRGRPRKVVPTPT